MLRRCMQPLRHGRALLPFTLAALRRPQPLQLREHRACLVEAREGGGGEESAWSVCVCGRGDRGVWVRMDMRTDVRESMGSSAQAVALCDGHRSNYPPHTEPHEAGATHPRRPWQ